VPLIKIRTMTFRARIQNALLRRQRKSEPVEEALARLPESFRSVLLGMYGGDQQLGADGKFYPLDAHTRIDDTKGMFLYDLCRSLRPQNTAEIGMAFGFSTLYILAALHENQTGRHTSIDPFQPAWNQVGLNQPDKVGMGHAFRFIGEKSVPALAGFARNGEQFEMIFIDGNHRFDDVLVDFTLSAEVSPIGGYLLLDDLWMPSVRRALSFIRKNRMDFQETPTPCSGLAAFMRIGEDSRPWHYHVDF
jgi:predicted O-methyltransferase YrrM